mmetsp:Transcript_92846/g.178255  ORF Transcript_92846/g.178255 Transcript_92846/m.178255 type:complete len:698 (+) Transcript_92846:48-2141(+)
MIFHQIPRTFSLLGLISASWLVSGRMDVPHAEDTCLYRSCSKVESEDAKQAAHALSLLQVSAKADSSRSVQQEGPGSRLSLLAGKGEHVQQFRSVTQSNSNATVVTQSNSNATVFTQSNSNASAGSKINTDKASNQVQTQAQTETILSSDLMTDEAKGFSWIMMSPIAACQYNAERIPVMHGEEHLTLQLCKTKCMARPTCEAIDYYQLSGWCNLYDKACSGPTTLKDGASSYRLNRTLSLRQMNATVQPVPPAPPRASKEWKTISWTAACEQNSQGIPDIFSKGGFSFARCKDKCEKTDNCLAIDFYSQTGWCILYDTPCTTPLKVKDGSSSHRLVDVASRHRHPLALIEKVRFPTAASNVRDVEKFMTDFGSPWAAAQMQEDQIDGEAFLMLLADDLKNYGVKRGPALKLSKRIQEAAARARLDDDVKTNALHEVVGPDGVLVISTDSDGDRYQQTRKKLRQAGINTTRFAAADEALASSQELEPGCPHEGDDGVKDSCLAANKTGYGCASKAEQAVAASHLNALLAAKRRSSDWTAILEDDAVPFATANWSSIFRSAWSKVPSTVKMVRLGWCQIDVLNYADPVIEEMHASVNGAILTQRIGYGKFSSRTFHYEPGGCTTAYLVHKDILEDLISLFPCCGAVDACYKWDYFKRVNPKTGIERGVEVMMSIDSHQHPVVNGVIEHHGLILQDLGL